MTDDPGFIPSPVPPTPDDAITTLEQIEPMAMPSLNVHVDFLDLLDRYDGDLASTYAILTDLKDLLG